MAIKFSQFNLRTDHTSGMYLVGYDGNQNIHITVDNLFDDFINGTENTIAMFGTDGTELVDSILSQDAGATLLTVAGQLNVDAAATFDTNITVAGNSTLNGNVGLGGASTDLIIQTGTLYLNGPVKDVTDTLGTTDQVLLSNASGNLTFTYLADLHVGGAEVVEVPVKNAQGSALVKGDPVYISGSVGASGRLEVQLADASNTLKMPAVGLLKQDLANNAEGFAVVTGKLRNLITDPIDGVNPTENDVIYVKPSGTSGAALTTTKPVYGNFIQNIGKVGRVSTSNDGNLVVSSILRTNDIPNLTPGRLWVGSTGNTIESQTLFVNEANTRLGIGTATPGYTFDAQTTGSGDVANFEASGTAGIRIANSNAPLVTRITSTNQQTSFKSDGSIEFYTDGAASGSGTSRMIIENSTGDVGIGIPTPDTRLHVKDDVHTIAKFEGTDEVRSQIILLNGAASDNAAYLMISTPTSTGRKRIALGRTNNPNNRDLLKIENQVATNYTAANMSFGSTGVGAQNKFAVTYDYNTEQDTAFNGILIDANITGTTAITGDKTLTGLNVDMDCSASGGNQTQELQLRGINVDVMNSQSGDANHIYGVYARASSIRNGTGDNISDITGGYFQALNSAKTGEVTNMYGTYSYARIEDSTHTIDSAFGSLSKVEVTNSFDATISTKAVGSRIVVHLDDTNDNVVPLLIGADVENVIDSNLATSEGVRVVKDINNNLTITDSYLFKGTVEKPASSTITNNWGLYLENIDKNYLQGTLRLPTYGQGNVTGTAAKNLAVDSNGNVIETDGGVVDGSGTTNYVSKWSDPNTLTDSVIYDDGTNVGIGTSSPGSTLTVRRSGSGSPFRIEDSGGVVLMNVNEDALGNAEVRLNNSLGTQTVRLDTSGNSYFNGGNVGIGTASPSRLFHIDAGTTTAFFRLQGGGGFGRYTEMSNNDNDFLLRADSSNTGTSTGTVNFAVGPTDGVQVAGSGQVTFWQYGSGTFTGTAAKNLAVDSSGNVIETDGGVVTGTGTTNTLALWSNGPNGVLSNSILSQTTPYIGFNTGILDINGTLKQSGTRKSVYIGENVGQSVNPTSGFLDMLNIGIGDDVLKNFVKGVDNSGASETTGENVGIGYKALETLINGTNNLAVGVNSLFSLTLGANNIAFGKNALQALTGNRSDSLGNVAAGFNTLSSMTTGTFNVAIGNTNLEATTSANSVVSIGNDVAKPFTGTITEAVLIGNKVLANTTATNVNDAIIIGQNSALGTSGTLTNDILIGRNSFNGNTSSGNNIAIGGSANQQNGSVDTSIAITTRNGSGTGGSASSFGIVISTYDDADVGVGSVNDSQGKYSTIIGGIGNLNQGANGFIGGGKTNTIVSTATNSAILGGFDNEVQSGGSGGMALGSNLQVNGNNQVVVGRYNTPNNNSKLIVGAGFSNANRINAFEVKNTSLIKLGKYGQSTPTFPVIGLNYNILVTQPNNEVREIDPEIFNSQVLNPQPVTIGGGQVVNLAADTNKLVTVNWTGTFGTGTLRLPTAANFTNKTMQILAANGFDPQTIPSNLNITTSFGSGETIDGQGSYTGITKLYDTVTLWSNGTEWFVLQVKT